MHKAVGYLRVSTREQGISGLGFEAQRESIECFASAYEYKIAEGDWFEEVASGKGADALKHRPILRRAIRQATRLKGFLICAKMDRLSRNTFFVTKLLDERTKFRIVDAGNDADSSYLRFLAALAEREREQNSRRTSEALQAVKRRGQILGNTKNLREVALRGSDTNRRQADDFAHDVLPHIISARAAGARTYRAIADALNRLGVQTARDTEWHPDTVRRLESRYRGQTREVVACEASLVRPKPRQCRRTSLQQIPDEQRSRGFGRAHVRPIHINGPNETR